MTASKPSPCPDCDATATVTVGLIARRDGSRGEIEFVETVHAASCPTLRGVV